MAVYKDKKTGKWNFRVYVSDPITNKRIQVQRNGFDLKRDAIDAEANTIANYESKDVILSRITFRDLIDEYLVFQKKRVKRTTYVNYVYMIDKHIMPFFNNLKITEINRNYLEKWYKYVLDLDTSSNHQNKLLTRLKSIINYAEDQYGIRVRYLNTMPPFKNSVEEVKDNKVIYDEKTFKKFISSASNELEIALFNTMFYAGARVGEIRALTWNDISLKENYINIDKQATSKVAGAGTIIIKPKTESSVRKVFIPNNLVDVLNSWYINRRQRKGFDKAWRVFGDNGFVSENRIRRMVKTISKEAKVPYMTLHGFRHSYTSLLYSKKVDPKIMQEQAGHSSIQVTLDIYTHLEKEETKNTIIDIFDDNKNNN